MKAEPLVYTITLNWNTRDSTVECIRSIQEMDYENMISVVVDNGSTDGSAEYLQREFGDKIVLIESGGNLGYSKGFNIGIRYAMENNPDYIFIHNNDIILDRNALKELVLAAENGRVKEKTSGSSAGGDSRDMHTGKENGDVGFVTGKVYFYDKPDVLQMVGRKTHPRNLTGRFVGTNEKDTGQYDELKEYDYCDDVFLLVNPRVIEELGAYDPDFFLMYEITDWCSRIRRRGYRIIFTPGAKIWHKVSLSHGGIGNPLTRYFLSRNRILFMRKNASDKIFRNFLLRSLTVDLLAGLVTYSLKWRFDLALAQARGKLSALKWLISHKSPELSGKN